MKRRMSPYEQQALKEMKAWQRKMRKGPSIFNRMSKRMQDKLNSIIPEKIHQALTTTIKQMIRAVLFGAEHTTALSLREASLSVREQLVEDKILFYRNTAAVEGGITGAGGILLGLADFPILIGIKIKLLFEIASIYGHRVEDYKERLYILYIFQIAFSSQQERKKVFEKMDQWKTKEQELPEDINAFDWRVFQQEYRDYIDLAKMAQLIPLIGAPVGVVVNYRLLRKLGHTAMQAYRMRWFESEHS